VLSDVWSVLFALLIETYPWKWPKPLIEPWPGSAIQMQGGRTRRCRSLTMLSRRSGD